MRDPGNEVGNIQLHKSVTHLCRLSPPFIVRCSLKGMSHNTLSVSWSRQHSFHFLICQAIDFSSDGTSNSSCVSVAGGRLDCRFQCNVISEAELMLFYL